MCAVDDCHVRVLIQVVIFVGSLCSTLGDSSQLLGWCVARSVGITGLVVQRLAGKGGCRRMFTVPSTMVAIDVREQAETVSIPTRVFTPQARILLGFHRSFHFIVFRIFRFQCWRPYSRIMQTCASMCGIRFRLHWVHQILATQQFKGRRGLARPNLNKLFCVWCVFVRAAAVQANHVHYRCSLGVLLGYIKVKGGGGPWVCNLSVAGRFANGGPIAEDDSTDVI